MLDNCTNQNMAEDVPILYLFKKDNKFVQIVRTLVKKEYKTPAVCQYYDEVSKNTKAKWRIYPTEPRMEFYLKMLQDFVTPEENVVGVFCEPKFMLAAKVSVLCLEDTTPFLLFYFILSAKLKMDSILSTFCFGYSTYRQVEDKRPNY